jgi:hypothetical protein
MDSKNISSIIQELEDEKERLKKINESSSVKKKIKFNLLKIEEINDKIKKMKNLENDVLLYENDYMSIISIK